MSELNWERDDAPAFLSPQTSVIQEVVSTTTRAGKFFAVRYVYPRRTKSGEVVGAWVLFGPGNILLSRRAWKGEEYIRPEAFDTRVLQRVERTPEG